MAKSGSVHCFIAAMAFVFAVFFLVSSAGVFSGDAEASIDVENRKLVAPDTTAMVVDLKGVSFLLDWEADFESQLVEFRVTFGNPRVIDSERWLLIGFSMHGFVEKSDFCLFNNGQLIDGYVDTEQNLQRDIHQDCNLLTYDNQKGNFAFSRRFTTCDIRDFAIQPGTTQFLLATGLGKVNSLKDKGVTMDFRYNQLLQQPVPEAPPDPDTRTMEIRAADAHVPAQETTYWCAIVRLDPELQARKHHIVRMEPLIARGSEQLVHHMEVFHCVSEEDASEEFNGDCLAGGKPQMAHMCSKVLAAWAMGAGTVVYPREAGLPFGGPGFRPLVMVEIHYNNPQRRAGIVDNSGFRFHFTPNLRPHDAGILELGLIYSDANSIPPQQPAFPISAFCTSDCTQRLPSDGIHVFGTQLHAHLTGRRLWTSHFRLGVKVGELNHDDSFSPHWQHIQMLQRHVHVRRGDVLVTTCVFDTRDKPEFVFGGYEISNEMCVNYLYYYPVSEVEVCKSAVDNTTLHRWFQVVGGIPVNATLKIHEKYNKMAAAGWTPELSGSLRELYSSGRLNQACLRHDGTLFPGHPHEWQFVPRPEAFAGVFDKKRARDECAAIDDWT